MVRNLVIGASVAILLTLRSVEVEGSVLGRRGKVNTRPIRPEATGLWQWRHFEGDRKYDAPADRLEYERREADYRPYRYYPMPDDVYWFGR